MNQLKPFYSVVIPVYKNELFIPQLIKDLNQLSRELPKLLEVLFVIDGSPDNSLLVLRKNIHKCEFQAKIIVLAKNVGSFLAIKAGLDNTRGKFAAIKAADRQEPIKLIKQFFDVLLKDQADIVVGVRASRNDSLNERLSSRMFWKFYKKTIDNTIPATGVDMFAINDRVIPYITSMTEKHSSLVSYLYWLGFRKKEILYHRSERKSGKSGWTLNKKVGYMLDSIFSFSTMPVTLFFVIGTLSTVSSFAFGLYIVFARMSGIITVPGYSATAIISLFFFGIITIELSIICNYIWRTFENTKQRPHYIIQETHEYEPK